MEGFGGRPRDGTVVQGALLAGYIKAGIAHTGLVLSW